MKSLRISPRIEAPSIAIIKIGNISWGSLPVKLLQPFFVSPQEQELSADDEARLIQKLGDHARDLLFDYLARAEHSEAGCRNYLKRKHFHPQIIDAVIEQAKELNFLSDARFSELYIRSLLDAGKSRRYIIGKLKIHRIPASLYNPVFEEYFDPEDSITRLAEEISRLLVNYGDIPISKKKEKAYSSLYRRGWEMDLISKAWRKVMSDV